MIEIKGIQIGAGKPVVCVPVSGRDDAEVLRLAREAVSVGAQMIEWRADAFSDWSDVARVRHVLAGLATLCRRCVLLVTLRTADEGGAVSLTPEMYARWLKQAAAIGGMDFLDVQTACVPDPEELVRWIHGEGSRALASFHDFEQTPPTEEIEERLLGMAAAGADLVKAAVMPQGLSDVLRLCEAAWRVSQKSRVPVAAMSMGETGMPTRVFGQLFGSSVTFASLSAASAPGQLSYAKTVRILDAVSGILEGRPVFLIGFMGVGKSTVARALARQTGWTLTDLDRELEAFFGKSINRIFAEEGEAVFRREESRLLAGMCGRGGAIISCGGGVIKNPDNVRRMRSFGTVVWLTATPATILTRVRFDDSRPLLAGKKNVEDIAALLAERAPAYEAAAHFAVSTDGRKAPEIARDILARISQEETPTAG